MVPDAHGPVSRVATKWRSLTALRLPAAAGTASDRSGPVSRVSPGQIRKEVADRVDVILAFFCLPLLIDRHADPVVCRQIGSGELQALYRRLKRRVRQRNFDRRNTNGHPRPPGISFSHQLPPGKRGRLARP